MTRGLQGFGGDASEALSSMGAEIATIREASTHTSVTAQAPRDAAAARREMREDSLYGFQADTTPEREGPGRETSKRRCQ